MQRGLFSAGRRFLHLGLRQQRLTLGTVGWIFLALALRRCMPTEHLFSLALPERGTRLAPSTVPIGELRAIVERKAALERASQALHIKNCLVRATALGLSLRRVGVGSTLHIGVRKTSQSALAAHAWVSIGGRVVIGGDQMEQAYVEILPETSPAKRMRGFSRLP
jgi:hypothetical protein